MAKDKLSPAWRAAFERIKTRAAEFAIEHDDWTIDLCVQVAMYEEALLNGIPDARPRGITGTSPITRR